MGTQTIVAGDFNGDGNVDLAAENQRDGQADEVAILYGDENGAFHDGARIADIPSGSRPFSVDLNSDGSDDLAFTNFNKDEVIIYLSTSGGSFVLQSRNTVGRGPLSLATADLNGDSLPDLVAADSNDGGVTVLLGRGDGTFGISNVFGTLSLPLSVVAGDFDGDGRDDVIVGDAPSATVSLASFNSGSDNVVLLHGLGDGSLQNDGRPRVDSQIAGLASKDFNGDGILDIAALGRDHESVSILLGFGDGTFQPQQQFSLPSDPEGIWAVDLNNDGRVDLAIACQDSNLVAILLGIGDGSFAKPILVPVEGGPIGLVSGYFNGDDQLDLAVACMKSGDCTILAGKGDGTFVVERTFHAGNEPRAIAAGDFNGDRLTDLAIVTEGSNSVSIYLQMPNGFRNVGSRDVGTAPVSVTVADFNGDKILDLAVANSGSNDASIFQGYGDGTFGAERRAALGNDPEFVTHADLNGDGFEDLVSAQFEATNTFSDGIGILAGRGDGTFEDVRFIDSGVADGEPALQVLTVGDFNGDGRADIAAGGTDRNYLPILLGNEHGSFSDSTTAFANEFQATPILADLDHDGLVDSVVVTRAGNILFRRGRAHAGGTFDPPKIINSDHAASSITLVHSAAGVYLAALDRTGQSISFYSATGNGTFRRTIGPTTKAEPVRIVAADLNGDRRDDLIVTNGVDFSATLFIATGIGGYRRVELGFLGDGASAITVANLNGKGGLDLVVTNQLSGDVSVILDPATAAVPTIDRFRAATGLYGVTAPDQVLQLHTLERPGGTAVGDFDRDGEPDLIVTHSGSNSFSLLRGTSHASFVNAETDPSWSTGAYPTSVVTGYFNRDRFLDIAILNARGGDISIFLGDGKGGFAAVLQPAYNSIPLRIDAGKSPSGLSSADVNGDGISDLLVGNDFGDLLILNGIGNGDFRAYRRADQAIPLAVADLNGDGINDFVLGNQGSDRIAVQLGGQAPKEFQGRTDGVLAPGAVQLVDVNGDTIKDMVVANGGSNNLLVYLGQSDGTFGAANKFFTGSAPSGFFVKDVNNDQVPDIVVANSGSNDVSVLFGQGTGSAWTFVSGPRLNSGGIGPADVMVQDITGDGIPDLLVSNRQSGTIAQLDGVGGGFFNDLSPKLFNVGQGVGQFFVGNFGDGQDLVAINALTNSITRFANFDNGNARTFSSGGTLPEAAFAGDFNGDGFSDLVVGNAGSGVISLLLSGPNGFQVSSTSLPFADASSLVFDSFINGDLSFYATSGGNEHVFQVSLDLGIAVITPGSGGSGNGGERPQSTGLSAFDTSDFVIVAVVVTGEQDVNLSAITDGFASELSGDAAQLVALVTGLVASGEEVSVSFAFSSSFSDAPDTNASLTIFIIGVDAAEQQIHLWFRLQVPSVPRSDSGGQADAPDADVPISDPATAPAPSERDKPEAAPSAEVHSESECNQLNVLDLAIAGLCACWANYPWPDDAMESVDESKRESVEKREARLRSKNRGV